MRPCKVGGRARVGRGLDAATLLRCSWTNSLNPQLLSPEHSLHSKTKAADEGPAETHRRNRPSFNLSEPRPQLVTGALIPTTC